MYSKRANRRFYLDVLNGLINLIKITIILTSLLTQSINCKQTINDHRKWNQQQQPPGKSASLTWQQVEPDFEEPVANQTVAVTKDVQLACKVSNLGQFRTAWLRVEDRSILTIHNSTITRNYRIVLTKSDDGNTFFLNIKNVEPSDRGGYMCQINSVPVKYSIGYLDVLTPPIFSDNDDATTNKSSKQAGFATTQESTPGDLQQQDAPIGGAKQATSGSQLTVSEGSNATLSCRAQGHPEPSIVWRREDGQAIQLDADDDSSSVKQIETSSISFPKINRLHSGAYLCIASNGIQPSASKRQVLDVQFGPIVRLPQTEVSASNGQPEAQLECIVESNPIGNYHWVKLATSTSTSNQPVASDANQREADDLWLIEHDELMQSDKFDIVIKHLSGDKVHMVLSIRRLERQDFGWYKCIARNSKGLQSSAILLTESPSSTLVSSSSFRTGSLTDGAHHTLSGGEPFAETNPRQRTQSRSSWMQRSTSPNNARSQQVASSAQNSNSQRISMQTILVVFTLVSIMLF